MAEPVELGKVSPKAREAERVHRVREMQPGIEREKFARQFAQEIEEKEEKEPRADEVIIQREKDEGSGGGEGKGQKREKKDDKDESAELGSHIDVVA